MRTVHGSGVALDDGAAIGLVAYAIREAGSVAVGGLGHMTGHAAVLHQLRGSNGARLRLTSGAEVAIKVSSVNSDGACFQLLR